MTISRQRPRRRRGRPLIVGRERERSLLRELLVDANTSRGSLAIVSGEAGIGKTTLVDDVIHEAEQRDDLVLNGGCYDLTMTPPYGPWIEIIRSYPTDDETLPLLPRQLRDGSGMVGISSQVELFELVRDFFVGVSGKRPLLLVLEDLHWSDPASLDLLRFLGRSCAEHRILLLATYRDDELSREHELARTLPALVRESRPERLRLPPLDQQAIHAFIASHYDLDAGNLRQLVEHVWKRADGNPFFVSEILQGLEDEQLLQRTPDGWQLRDTDLARIPPLLRQVIDDRLAHLSPETHTALQIAAVIGQEIRLRIWREVSDLSRCDLDSVLAEAFRAHLIEEMPVGTALRFRHVLFREALYKSLTLMQRRYWHGRTAEALATQSPADPDRVAYHFQQARDPRAKGWLIRAGEHAQRSFAWLSAADRFTQALTWIGEDGQQAPERGWLLYRTGGLLRHSDHRRARSYLERAYRLASEHGDAVLAAYALWNLGRVRWLSGDMRRGLDEMAEGEERLGKLPADHASPGSPIATSIADNLPASETRQFPDIGIDAASTVRGTRVGFSAHTGHVALARRLGEDYLQQVATIQQTSALLIGSIWS